MPGPGPLEGKEPSDIRLSRSSRPEELIKYIEANIDQLEAQAEKLITEARTAIEELSKIAIPGTIIWRKVKCGKPSCRSCPHGPYAYLVKPDGKHEYIGKEVPWRITRGVEAWKTLKDLKPQLSTAERTYQELRATIRELKALLKLAKTSLWWLRDQSSSIVHRAEVWLASPEELPEPEAPQLTAQSQDAPKPKPSEDRAKELADGLDKALKRAFGVQADRRGLEALGRYFAELEASGIKVELFEEPIEIELESPSEPSGEPRERKKPRKRPPEAHELFYEGG